ncbi:hypothetical protein HK102_009422 [Quaeritorhiza haematococci]|nr:hypothetical protein HK102_009422 [Quaeritorhiza haematococci]
MKSVTSSPTKRMFMGLSKVSKVLFQGQHHQNGKQPGDRDQDDEDEQDIDDENDRSAVLVAEMGGTKASTEVTTENVDTRRPSTGSLGSANSLNGGKNNTSNSSGGTTSQNNSGTSSKPGNAAPATTAPKNVPPPQKASSGPSSKPSAASVSAPKQQPQQQQPPKTSAPPPSESQTSPAAPKPQTQSHDLSGPAPRSLQSPAAPKQSTEPSPNPAAKSNDVTNQKPPLPTSSANTTTTTTTAPVEGMNRRTSGESQSSLMYPTSLVNNTIFEESEENLTSSGRSSSITKPSSARGSMVKLDEPRRSSIVSVGSNGSTSSLTGGVGASGSRTSQGSKPVAVGGSGNQQSAQSTQQRQTPVVVSSGPPKAAAPQTVQVKSIAANSNSSSQPKATTTTAVEPISNIRKSATTDSFDVSDLSDFSDSTNNDRRGSVTTTQQQQRQGGGANDDDIDSLELSDSDPGETVRDFRAPTGGAWGSGGGGTSKPAFNSMANGRPISTAPIQVRSARESGPIGATRQRTMMPTDDSNLSSILNDLQTSELSEGPSRGWADSRQMQPINRDKVSGFHDDILDDLDDLDLEDL